MPHAPYCKARLFVEHGLSPGASLVLDAKPSHYLAQVLRMKEGEYVALFNGRDGEWTARIDNMHKRGLQLQLAGQRRAQASGPDVWLLFAPIKQGRIDWLVEKATELGAAKLLPVMTEHTAVSRINLGRLHAHAIEAAEQCERLDVPELKHEKKLTDVLAEWPADRALLYGDETGGGVPIKDALEALVPQQKVAVLVGPEGGFSSRELAMLKAHKPARGVGLGPRILRADTAAAAMLACVQAWCGDGEKMPAFETRGAHAG